jgi:hypothetical protein
LNKSTSLSFLLHLNECLISKNLILVFVDYMHPFLKYLTLYYGVGDRG